MHFGQDLVFEPAAQAIEQQVVAVFQATANIAKKTEGPLGITAALKQMMQIQEGVGFLARDVGGRGQQLGNGFERTARMTMGRNAVLPAGGRWDCGGVQDSVSVQCFR